MKPKTLHQPCLCPPLREKVWALLLSANYCWARISRSAIYTFHGLHWCLSMCIVVMSTLFISFGRVITLRCIQSRVWAILLRANFCRARRRSAIYMYHGFVLVPRSWQKILWFLVVLENHYMVPVSSCINQTWFVYLLEKCHQSAVVISVIWFCTVNMTDSLFKFLFGKLTRRTI